MRFVADDGKIFNNYEECEEYETKMIEGKEIAEFFRECVVLKDGEGQILNINLPTNTCEYLDSISKIIEGEAFYMSIGGNLDISQEENSKIYQKAKEYFYIMYGIILPSTRGIWRYDGLREDWVDIIDEGNKLIEKWKPYFPDIHITLTSQ